MTARSVVITVLADNTRQSADLLDEHGLSLWIETPDARVLFDTGQGPALPHNAAALDVPLDRADAIVLSHGHYDHTGGLRYALDRAPQARLFLHPSALAPRFTRRDGVSREIGMPGPVREAVHERQASVTWTQTPTQVAPGLFVTGPIPRWTGFEDTGGPFFLDQDGTVSDLIEDDQAIWAETASGIVVLLGCAHAGVVNTLDFIRAQSGPKRVQAVIGGMHLGAASEARLDRTLGALERLDVGDLWPCHCTGAVATERLATAFGRRCHPCDAGLRIELPHGLSLV